MYRSAAYVTGQSSSFRGERRRRLRHKLHTPVFVSFNGADPALVVDLSELVDLSEDGFAVQTAPGRSAPAEPDTETVASPSGAEARSQTVPTESAVQKSIFTATHGFHFESAGPQTAGHLESGQAVKICLDLPETRSFVHGSGLVIWRDDSGRVGIRFSYLPDSERNVLKEWLFVNLLVAGTNHASRSAQLIHRSEAPSEIETASSSRIQDSQSSPPALETSLSQRAQLLSALDDVRRQIREIQATRPATRDVADAVPATAKTAANDPSEPVLNLLTERALSLTGATGSALALLVDSQMICRARSGDPAPQLGSIVNISEGLSGECVRSGLPVFCVDTNADPRVDLELCRILGIGALLAVPIISKSRVIGLLEIFYSCPSSISNIESEILERLAEVVPVHHNKQDRCAAVVQSIQVPSASSVAILPQRVSIVPLPSEQPKAELSLPESEEQPEVKPVTVEPNKTQPAEPEFQSDPIGTSSSSGLRFDDLSLPSFDPVPAAPEASSFAEPPTPKLRDALSKNALWEEESKAEHLPSGTRSSSAHLALILCAVAAVALALGYLLAPTIEKRFSHVAEGSTKPPETAIAVQPSTSRPSGKALTPEDLQRLADQGDAEAQWQLGTLYRNGDGVPQNDAQAIQWFQRSADKGYAPAMSSLGSSYWAGRGVPQSYGQAYFWYTLALAEGDQNSKPLLEGLATQLTARQVATIREQAEAWLRSHTEAPKSASR